MRHTSFWKLINKQRTRRDKIYPEITYKNVTATDPESIANLFASYYTDVYTLENNTDSNEPHKQEIDSTYHNTKKLSQNDFHQIDDITHTEILQAIISLKLRKAPGTDGIQAEHLKYGGKSVIHYICVLFYQTIGKRAS